MPITLATDDTPFYPYFDAAAADFGAAASRVMAYAAAHTVMKINTLSVVTRERLAAWAAAGLPAHSGDPQHEYAVFNELFFKLGRGEVESAISRSRALQSTLGIEMLLALPPVQGWPGPLTQHIHAGVKFALDLLPAEYPLRAAQ